MNSLPRSCVTALARAAKSPQIPNASRRAFSRAEIAERAGKSARRELPVFREPSTLELSVILSNLNKKILLPRHLTHEQQLLVYKEKNRARLEAEPLYITLGEVELPLEHIDRTHDIPDQWHTIRQVVDMARTSYDWENVMIMLAGFHKAGIQLRPQWQEKIVRKMIEKGQLLLLIRGLEKVRETGLSMKHEWVRELVLLGIRDKAAGNGWSLTGTHRTLRGMEHIIQVMEHPMHLGKSDAAPGDPRATPWIIAYLLELAAVRAKLHYKADKNGAVATYALRMMMAFKQDDFMKTTFPAAISEKLGVPTNLKTPWHEKHAFSELRRNVVKFIPMWNGLQTASAVLGTKMPMAAEAKTITSQLGKALQSAKKTLEKHDALRNVGEKLDQCKI